jgi:MFS family permease
MLMAMVAERTPPARRTIAFSQMQAGILIAEVIAVPICAPFILTNPWIPLWGSMGLMILGGVISLVLVPSSPNEPTTPLDRKHILAVMREELGQSVDHCRELIPWMTQNLGVLLILLAFFVSITGKQATTVMILYASKKLDWSFKEVSDFVRENDINLSGFLSHRLEISS